MTDLGTWQRTPWWLRLLGRPAWRQPQPYLPDGWRYASKPYRWKPN